MFVLADLLVTLFREIDNELDLITKEYTRAKELHSFYQEKHRSAILQKLDGDVRHYGDLTLIELGREIQLRQIRNRVITLLDDHTERVNKLGDKEETRSLQNLIDKLAEAR